MSFITGLFLVILAIVFCNKIVKRLFRIVMLMIDAVADWLEDLLFGKR